MRAAPQQVHGSGAVGGRRLRMGDASSGTEQQFQYRIYRGLGTRGSTRPAIVSQCLQQPRACDLPYEDHRRTRPPWPAVP